MRAIRNNKTLKSTQSDTKYRRQANHFYWCRNNSENNSRDAIDRAAAKKWPRTQSLGKMKIYGVFSLFTVHISQLSVVSAQVFVYCHLIYSIYILCVAHGPLNFLRCHLLYHRAFSEQFYAMLSLPLASRPPHPRLACANHNRIA